MEKYFNLIPNKNLGKQDYSKIGKGDKKSAIGKLPFEGNMNEMVVMNSYQEIYKLIFCWTMKNNVKRSEKKSVAMIKMLLDNKAEGSLFSCLTDRNYA